MQYILTQEELDNLAGEIKEATTAYIYQYKQWLFQRSETVIKHVIELSRNRCDVVDQALVREFIRDYDNKHPEPKLPKNLQ